MHNEFLNSWIANQFLNLEKYWAFFSKEWWRLSHYMEDLVIKEEEGKFLPLTNYLYLQFLFLTSEQFSQFGR